MDCCCCRNALVVSDNVAESVSTFTLFSLSISPLDMAECRLSAGKFNSPLLVLLLELGPLSFLSCGGVSNGLSAAADGNDDES